MILKLLSGKDQRLLVWMDAYLVLELGFHVLNGVSWPDIQGEGLSGESLDVNFKSLIISKILFQGPTQIELEKGFFLNIVVREYFSIFKLLMTVAKPLII